jgi:hypothetical protein
MHMEARYGPCARGRSSLLLMVSKVLAVVTESSCNGLNPHLRTLHTSKLLSSFLQARASCALSARTDSAI